MSVVFFDLDFALTGSRDSFFITVVVNHLFARGNVLLFLAALFLLGSGTGLNGEVSWPIVTV